MTINIIRQPDLVYVQLVGSYDTLAAQQCDTQWKELCTLANSPVTIDCSKLDFISSSGLRHFLTLYKHSVKLGGKITISSMRPEIRESFVITSFDSLFDWQ